MRIALTLAAAGLATLGTFAAPAGVASADKSALETIGQLEADGYTVNIDRVGSAPIEDCVVTSVRNPNTNTRWVRVNRGDHSVLVPVVVSRTISVSLYCAR
jgi:hypothetical protein